MNNNPITPAEILKELQTKRKGRPNLENEYLAPTDELEISLAEIWSEVLRLSPVGRLDNFFMLGGDSMDILLILNRVRSSLGVELDFADLFFDPTVAGVVKLIRLTQGQSIGME
ncbi:MAG: phosphopantetheine-binding protein [Acidobacteriota bacterium]|nr:phosphopantetheine-binding protein [Acidobacteriota bacterium]